MARYFIQVSYKGTNYAGFQIQKNANSIQAEIEKALKIFFKEDFTLTCSSRTDAGVQALNNYFHFDSDIIPNPDRLNKIVYNLNAILPGDIVIKSIFRVPDSMHARFSAKSRLYRYYIYQQKDPFRADRAFYYPYGLELGKLNEAAALLKDFRDFTSFSNRNTQVKTFLCDIYISRWTKENDLLIYEVEGNRFLRGMVRGLVGTMLRVGTGKISITDFREIIETKDCSLADFSVPPHALFLADVKYPVDIDFNNG
jgi:tRNA pseudouridine38-40 synthase